MNLLAVGDALLDTFITASDKVPEDLGLAPGQYHEVEETFLDHLLVRFPHKEFRPGGTSANTLRLAAALGLSCTFVGVVGNDHHGDLFRRAMADAGVQFHNTITNGSTGLCLTFIHPEGRRTIITNRGASGDLSPRLLPPGLLDSQDVLILEGYQIQNRELLYFLLRQCRQRGIRILFDPANNLLAQHHRQEMRSLWETYATWVLANEEETLVLSGGDLNSSLETLGPGVDSFIIKRGSQGCLGIHGGKKYTQAPPQVTIKDPSGSGDGFAAGFLWGISQGLSFERCLLAGTQVAGEVLQSLGAETIPGTRERLQSTFHRFRKSS